MGIISNKTAAEKVKMLSYIWHGCSYEDMTRRKLQCQFHQANESTRVNILLSLVMAVGSTLCKPSQDVSERTHEQIQLVNYALLELCQRRLGALMQVPGNSEMAHFGK